MVERRGQVEDGLAVLDRHDASGDEGAAVTDAVDLVQDRYRRVARPQEVGVQRVHEELRVDGARRCHQSLAGDLTAEHPLAFDVGAAAPEDVLLDLLQIEERMRSSTVLILLSHGAACSHLAGFRRTVPGHERARFPEGFRWGTATAAHQVEGNNVNNDWWEWEHRENTRVRRTEW